MSNQSISCISGNKSLKLYLLVLCIAIESIIGYDLICYYVNYV